MLKQLGGNRNRLLWLEAKSAHAMGIIGNELKSQLDRFRSIRNAFAHAMLSVSFDDELIAAECRSPPHSQLLAALHWPTWAVESRSLQEQESHESRRRRKFGAELSRDCKKITNNSKRKSLSLCCTGPPRHERRSFCMDESKKKAPTGGPQVVVVGHVTEQRPTEV